MKNGNKLTALLLATVLGTGLTACGTGAESSFTWDSEEESLSETLSPEEIASAIAEVEDFAYTVAETQATDPILDNPPAPDDNTDPTAENPAAPTDPANPASDPAATAPAADSAANDPNAAVVPAEPSSKFGRAIWLGHTNDGEERYFFFYDDRNGNYLEQETGMGVGFTYELSGEQVMFHFAAVDDNTPASIMWADDKTAYLTWSTGVGETLTWLRDDSSAPFDFFTNEQLCEMALGYYEAANGYRPSSAAAMINYDGMIAIQLYDNMGDHNSTSDWYTVDRYTAIGTNVIGETIDLKTAPLG